MYEPDTILKLKEPRTVGTPPQGRPPKGKEGDAGYVPASEDYVPASEDYEPFPYDRVKVVGVSPVNRAAIEGGEWEGPQGQEVIITPLDGFGSTSAEPYGKLQKLYDVEEVPVREGTVEAPVRVITPGTAGPTPEEVFAKDAPGRPNARGRTKRRSPLDVVPEPEAEARDDKGEPQEP